MFFIITPTNAINMAQVDNIKWESDVYLPKQKDHEDLVAYVSFVSGKKETLLTEDAIVLRQKLEGLASRG